MLKSRNRKKLYRIFANVLKLPEGSLTPDLSPENCPSWDSFNAMALISEIEKSFAIRYAYREAMSIKNLGDVVRSLERKGVLFDTDA